MSKLTIRVNPKTGKNYLPRHVRDEGFVGTVEVLLNALTLTFIRPGTDLVDVDKSLEIIRRDIALRIQQGKSDRKTQNKVPSAKLPVERMEVASGRPLPIFVKYSRNWLSQVTGYSKSYLCRVATGSAPLSKSFRERCCFSLHQTEKSLFVSDTP